MVNDTQIDSLLPLERLQNLKTLRVYNTNIKSLDPIKNLFNLENLYAHNTQIINLNPLKELLNLKDLALDETKVVDLTPLNGLKELKELSINDTSIENLKPIEKLTNLTLLHADNTYISDLLPLKNLLKLSIILLKNTKIKKLEGLENLEKIHILDIKNTQIQDLTPLKKLIMLGLNVYYDKPKVHGNCVYVENTPLSNPPIEIVKQGKFAILRYWKEQERVGKSKINEARLMLLGQGGAGKTSLQRKLIDKKNDLPQLEDTTRGINIETIEIQTTDGNPFTIKVWDFGGQNIQHYAHHFFMSDSVVYAVLSNTREQNDNFHYWLNIIELLGKNSPFFIVQNEREGHKEVLHDLVKIQERFPITYQGLFQVNLKEATTDPRFETMRLQLLHATTQLPHTQREVLTSFFNVQQKLKFRAATEQTLQFREFKELCSEEGIEDHKLMTDYALLMTQLGIALYFHDDRHLNKLIFLNPKWIIDALFELLYHPLVIEQNRGHFSIQEAREIWVAQEYSDMDDILLDLMVKFRLCYEVKRNEHYIVPQRLPARKTLFVPPPDATHLIYKYKFLPSGLLTQLICSLYEWIESERVWSDAVQFTTQNGKGRVFARENREEHKIELFGFDDQKSDLLDRVVDALDSIHRETKLKNLVVEKLIPCPCEICEQAVKTNKKQHFFDYNLMIDLLLEGESEERCHVSRKKILIHRILKHANIQIVKINEIRNLIAQNRLEEALNLLRGTFPNENELFLQLGRYNHLIMEDRVGIIERDGNNSELARLRKDILTLAETLFAS
ncbi:COR domain-containing protein [Haliscomenobacter sp.]|uniref:COR domain-containing protein n=1 Tax=Haliscomenobacter sp. TaxID=2717303 RepID=UPI0035941E7B